MIFSVEIETHGTGMKNPTFDAEEAMPLNYTLKLIVLRFAWRIVLFYFFSGSSNIDLDRMVYDSVFTKCDRYSIFHNKKQFVTCRF